MTRAIPFFLSSNFFLQSYDRIPWQSRVVFPKQSIYICIIFVFVFHLFDNSLKVLVSSFAVPRRAFYAIFAASDPVHVSISSRCELVLCNDDSKTPKHETAQPKKEAANQMQMFAATSSAKKLAKLGIPIEQSLSWHLSKNFHEDPLLRHCLKHGARVLCATVDASTETLFQALHLRNYLLDSNLVPVNRVIVPLLDAAIASALMYIGIETVLEHPSFTPHVIDSLLLICVYEKRQKLLPELFSLLKCCSSDIMQGKTGKRRLFQALPRFLMSVSHGFGCASLSAFDMLLRYIAPLATDCSDAGNVINQIIVPRFLLALANCQQKVYFFLCCCAGGLSSTYFPPDLSAKS
jgi:hypothetical protein